MTVGEGDNGANGNQTTTTTTAVVTMEQHVPQGGVQPIMMVVNSDNETYNQSVYYTTQVELIPKIEHEVVVHSTPESEAIVSVYQSHKDWVFYSVLGFIGVIYAILLISFTIANFCSGLVLLISIVAAVTTLVCVIPRQIEVWTTAVKIRFYPGYCITTRYEDIVGIEYIQSCTIFIGLKFTTSISQGRVAIYRRNNLFTSILISPSTPQLFVNQVRQMMMSMYEHCPPPSLGSAVQLPNLPC